MDETKIFIILLPFLEFSLLGYLLSRSLKTLNSAVVSAADDPLLLATEYRSQEFDPHAESRAIQLLLGR